MSSSLSCAEEGVSRGEMYLRSFHYFTFQINQALAFVAPALARAVAALRRALGDFKHAMAESPAGIVGGESGGLPEHFLWGVLTFLKNVLQVGE